MNNLKAKVDDLDFGKWRTVFLDLKKISDVEDNGVIKNTTFNTLKTRINNLEKESPDTNTLIQINQHNTDKQNMEKKFENVDEKIQDQVA